VQDVLRVQVFHSARHLARCRECFQFVHLASHGSTVLDCAARETHTPIALSAPVVAIHNCVVSASGGDTQL
jgi:hypothetical protein